MSTNRASFLYWVIQFRSPIADVTGPDLVSWIKESIGEGQPIEIVPELADHQ